MQSTRALVAWPVNIIFRPERLVSVGGSGIKHGRLQIIINSAQLMAVYSVNLILYAAPLTLAGYGVNQSVTTISGFFTALATNSAFLIAGTVLTLVTFHVGIVLSGASNGIVRSLRVVTYSTGVYLALGYTLVWYIATTPATSVAADILIELQTSVFSYFIDWFGVALQVPGEQLGSPSLAELTMVGRISLLLLFLSGLYYLYVLYAGSRIGHDANRIQAIIATGVVLMSPVMYVIGTIVFSLYS